MRILVFVAMVLFTTVLSGCLWRSGNDASYDSVPSTTSSTGIPARTQTDDSSAAAAVTTSPPAASAQSGSQTIVTLAEGLTGRISLVNSNLRFVVVTFPVGQMAKINQRMNIYRGGMKVGELLVTGPQREDGTVADITAGEAQVGDEARDR